MEFDNIDRFYKAIEAIKLLTNEIKIYGVYMNAREKKPLK
jgi:hypothetical protein